MVVYSKVTEKPLSEPVTLDEAKTHLRVTDSNDDDYITSLISVARQSCETYTGLSFIEQTRAAKLDKFPMCKAITLPYGPVISVDEFTYKNSDNVDVELVSGTDYFLDSHSDVVRLCPPSNGWPTALATIPNAVSITYTAGYGDAVDVPYVIKQSILLQVATLYEVRQDEIPGLSASPLNFGSQYLLDTVKVYYNARQD